MNAEVAEAVKDRRLLKGLGNRPIKGYDEVIPVFGISFDAPSRIQADGNAHSATR
jgi:hypothetical protein